MAGSFEDEYLEKREIDATGITVGDSGRIEAHPPLSDAAAIDLTPHAVRVPASSESRAYPGHVARTARIPWGAKPGQSSSDTDRRRRHHSREQKRREMTWAKPLKHDLLRAPCPERFEPAFG
jgi:hypothetical protein